MNTTLPKISVLMSTYKENKEILSASIESILNQSYSNFEFIILLDNPKNTLHKEVISDYAKKDPRIRFFINSVNKGVSESINYGLTLVTGKYIARMDADDISLPNRLEKQYAYLTKYNYDLVGGITEIIQEDGTLIYSIAKLPHEMKRIKQMSKYNQCLPQPTWLGKTELFLSLNGYRDLPFAEDYDFTLRALLKGYQLSNLNESVLLYRMSTQSLSRSNLLKQFLYAKYFGGKYSQGKVAALENAEAYLKKHYSEKKATRYSKANLYFNQALSFLNNKRYFSCLWNAGKAFFTSTLYAQKMIRFVIVQIYSYI